MGTMTPELRGEEAAQLKRTGVANCCQAVLLAFGDTLAADEGELRRLGAGFAVGMGGMEATCGALIGAGLVAGLRLGPGPAAVRAARDTLRRFEARCGATLCKDLKGRDTGRVLCPCEECCRNAVLALEAAMGGADAPK